MKNLLNTESISSLQYNGSAEDHMLIEKFNHVLLQRKLKPKADKTILDDKERIVMVHLEPLTIGFKHRGDSRDIKFFHETVEATEKAIVSSAKKFFGNQFEDIKFFPHFSHSERSVKYTLRADILLK